MTGESQIQIVELKYLEFETDIKELVMKYSLFLAGKYCRKEHEAHFMLEGSMTGESLSDLEDKAEKEKERLGVDEGNLVRAIFGLRGLVPGNELAELADELEEFVEGGILYRRRILRDEEIVGNYDRKFDGSQEISLRIAEPPIFPFSLIIEQGGKIDIDPLLNNGLRYHDVHRFDGQDYSDTSVMGETFLQGLERYLDSYLLPNEGE